MAKFITKNEIKLKFKVSDRTINDFLRGNQIEVSKEGKMLVSSILQSMGYSGKDVDLDDLVSIKELSELTGIEIGNLNHMALTGRIPHLKFKKKRGSSYFFPRKEALQAIENESSLSFDFRFYLGMMNICRYRDLIEKIILPIVSKYLTEYDVEVFQKYYLREKTTKELAEEYSVSGERICQILRKIYEIPNLVEGKQPKVRNPQQVVVQDSIIHPKLSARASRLLKKYLEIEEIEELSDFNLDYIKKIPAIGQVTLKNIIEVAKECKVKFAKLENTET